MKYLAKVKAINAMLQLAALILMLSVTILIYQVAYSPKPTEDLIDNPVSSSNTTSAYAYLPDSVNTETAKLGKELFQNNCTNCHAVHEVVIGPALKNVTERAPSRQWIYNFINNSTKVIQSGDPYAIKLYKEYKQTNMTSFVSLKKQDIDNILEYIELESEYGRLAVPVVARK